MSSNNNRSLAKDDVNLTFKILSALGIIIIVAGHTKNGGISLAYEWFPPYSFHLALFVFISGYFYKSKHEEHVLNYIWRRTKRLLIPAYIWNFVYGLFNVVLGFFGYKIGVEFNLYNIFIMPIIDGEGFLFNLGSWFVYPLFCVCVFNILFRKFLKPIHKDNEYIILAVYLAIGMLGIQIAINHSENGVHGLLLLATRSMFFLPCFEFGQFYKNKLEKRDNLSNTAYFSIIFLIQLILLTLYDVIIYTPSKMMRFENGVVVPYITAITGIAFWLRISKILAPAVKDWKPVRLIADNTYSIMIHQYLGFMTVKWMFYIIKLTTPLCENFDVHAMKTNIRYRYLPHGLQRYLLLYVAAGIFVPILIEKGTQKLTALIKKLINERKYKPPKHMLK